MDQFLDSLRQATQYPNNLVVPDAYPHALQSNFRRLDEQSRRLFCEEKKASLHFWECGDQGRGFQDACICNLGDLELHLGSGWEDPRARFMFITAPNSRERLNITREMFSFLFTFHQVMTGFLDFVYAYGRRENAQESHFGGFRQECRLADHLKGPQVHQLGRSGRDIRHCYNLVSVETSSGQRDWPWSIRQTAIYHSFDVIAGRASWIVVKANNLMERRVKEASKAFGDPKITSFQTNTRAFASSLYTHLIYISWAGEEWRWYIDFLEEETQKTTRKTLSTDVEGSAMATDAAAEVPSHRNPNFAVQVPSTYSPPSEKVAPQTTRPMTPPWSLPQPPPRSLLSSSTLVVAPSGFESTTSGSQRDFSFNDLQRVQFIEEKTNETIFVIGVNLSVLGYLKQFYQSLIDSEEFPGELRKDCARDVAAFSSRVASVEQDLRLQQSRANSLLRILDDRKNLLFGMLEYRNEQASRVLAEKAQSSAKKMESMTEEMHAMTGSMHKLAQKTKQETVSMRIITLVTLFFLPGTFISTLMSTDIVRWEFTGGGDTPTKTVSIGAITLFLEITLPLMLFTFIAWYGVYWWVNRNDRFKNVSFGHKDQNA